MKKDKQKVIGEELSDERLAQLLDMDTEQGVNPDYFILMRAYRGLRGHDFSRFLPMFQQAGRDLQAKGPEGTTLAQEIAEHGQSQEYMNALRQAEA